MLPTHKDTVYSWMDDNYDGNFRTIRSIWYAMKPYIQQCNAKGYKRGGELQDKSTTKLIGDYLWGKFIDGDRNIYGDIANSDRVSLGKLPVILFTEKNTLLPFGSDLSEHITSFEYNSSGQSNSYEIANICLALLEEFDTVYIYGVTDYDKAGDDIYNTVLDKFSQMFNIVDRRFDTDWLRYETYIQPNGAVGVELDAVTDLEEQVYSQLEEFLPTHLFEELAIDYKQSEVYNEAIDMDDEHTRLQNAITALEQQIWNEVISYQYDYDLGMLENLSHLPQRVTVTK